MTLSLGSSPIRAQDELARKPEVNTALPAVFQQQYVLLEGTKNFPLQRSLERFTSYRRTLGLTYLHRLNEEWIFGIGFNFKSLRKFPEDKEFAFSSLYNLAQYVIRLYHPLYLWVGGKWLYMLPVQYARVPMVKDPEFQLEFGAAANFSLVYKATDKSLISFRVDRWRGTKTNRFHGFELALGFGYSI